jgi:DNA-directed RNA polymerase specialized sigma24 family protein
VPFPATHLSLIRRVGSDDAETRSHARESLAAIYWTPVYAHIRLRHRQQPADAEDLTQGFFIDALRRDLFARYDASRARFRTYLRTCVDSYIANQKQAATRQKRGGQAVFLSIDTAEIEARLTICGESDSDRVFHREWVRGVFTVAAARLRERCLASGRAVHVALFERYDLADSLGERPTYAALAVEHRIPITQVTNWLAATRRDYRAIVLETLRDLTASDEEFRDEARDLLGIEVA